MAYDNFNYDIKSRLPEWWRQDGFLEPINRYTQEFIRDIVGSLLSSFGVVQPFHAWKTLPTEYSWIHTYNSRDPYLKYPQGGYSPLFLEPDRPIHAYIPNSKRNCHATIQLKLEGDSNGLEKPLQKLTIKNGNQQITFHDIKTTTDIKIMTEDNSILIDGQEQSDLVVGRFDKIYGQARNPNYNEVDVSDENKITYLSIESSEGVNFSLKVKLIHPIYVTEQNMRVYTVSAFPIEWIKLYGFYCHDFNNKQEWKFLWEKEFRIEDRVTHTRITKQFDCETFFMQVKLAGIGIPFVCGFPQERFTSNPAFQLNNRLDKWGRIFGLPRRYYKTHISEDEEPYTYPPFYDYDVEQDYWYEERLVSEYRHNDDAINSALIKDTNFNNIAILKCIDPQIQDLYVYTETIKNNLSDEHNTGEISPTRLDEEGAGKTWKNPHQIANSNSLAAEISLDPNTSKSFNEKTNQTQVLKVFFDNIPELPKNIEIKGIELKLNGVTNIHSDSLILDDRSKMLVPTKYTKLNGNEITHIDEVPINIDTEYWEKGKGTYTIGGSNILFNLPEIKREQVQDGMEFRIGFTNLNTFVQAKIILYGIQLIIHYKTIEDSYNMEVELSDKEIILENPEKQSIKMRLLFENIGDIPVVNKNVNIIGAEGLNISKTRFRTFDLDIGEDDFVIGDSEEDEIIITPKKYKRLKLTNNSEVSKIKNIEEDESFQFYYRTNNKATIHLYAKGPETDGFILLDEFTTHSNALTRYQYQLQKKYIDNEEETKDPAYYLGTDPEFKVVVDGIPEDGYLFLKEDEWPESELETILEPRTGLYDIIVFCNDESYKETITIKEKEVL